MAKDHERRRFHRINFSVPVELRQNEWRAAAEVIDISLKGVLIKGDQLNFDHDDEISIRIDLSHEIHIDMTAALAHHEKNTYAFHWVEVDIESMSHLRRLLELNTGDVLLMERELANLRAD